MCPYSSAKLSFHLIEFVSSSHLHAGRVRQREGASQKGVCRLQVVYAFVPKGFCLIFVFERRSLMCTISRFPQLCCSPKAAILSLMKIVQSPSLGHAVDIPAAFPFPFPLPFGFPVAGLSRVDAPCLLSSQALGGVEWALLLLVLLRFGIFARSRRGDGLHPAFPSGAPARERR